MSLEETATAECKMTVVPVTDVDGYYNVIVEVKRNGISSRDVVTVPGKSCGEAFRHAASELRRNNHDTHPETDEENPTTSSIERTHEE